MTMDARNRATNIKLMIFDVDGVMTDGGLHYTDTGRELKTFNVLDGFGLKFLQRGGITVAFVTGRTSGVVGARAVDLGIEHVYQGVADKATVADTLRKKLGLTWPEVAFMGDDFIDLRAMIRCGLAVAPANAHPRVKGYAQLITEATGGHGAVREAAEFVLTAQEKLEALVAEYLEP